MKRRPGRYYIKWVLLCFAITSLPVILLGIFSYAKSSGVVQQKVSEEKALKLEQSQMNLEHTLKVVDQAATHFLGSKIITTALNEPLSPDQFQLFTQIKSELNGLQRLDTGINDILLLSNSSNWLINNDGLFRLDTWMKNHVGALSQTVLPSIWEVSRNSVPAFPDNSCQISVNLIKRLPLAAYRSSGMAIIQIPACNFKDLLFVNEDNESLLVYDEKAQLIVQEGMAVEGLENSLNPMLSNFSKKMSGSFTLEANQKDYNLTFRKSDYNNWVYVSIVTVDQLTKQSREIGWFTLYICLGLLILFILLAWYGSKRLYRPISNIYKDVVAQQNSGFKDSAADEIQWIGQQISALFNTKKQLESRLHGQTQLLRTFFMIKLFLGGMKEAEIVERMESYDLRKDFSRFSVLALQIGSLEQTRFADKDLDLLLFAINNVVAELVPDDRRLHPIVFGRSQLTIITGKPDTLETFKSDVFAFAQLIQQKVSELFDFHVNIGISITYSQLINIPRAYEEAAEALKRRAVFGEHAIVLFEDLGENHTLHYNYPFDLQSQLFDAVKLVNRDQAKPLLHQILHEICGSNPNPYDLQFNTVRLLMNLLGLANGIAGQSFPMQQQQSLFDELFGLDIPAEGEAWFNNKIIDPLMSEIEAQTEVRHLSIAKEVVKMIHEQFDTDLSIDSCADRLHYNASYVSTIFRKSMDISFSAYLAQYRHQVALKWLKETDMAIKEIAEKLRYNNPQNFIRSFKKIEDISPGKFREMERGIHSKDYDGGETSHV